MPGSRRRDRPRPLGARRLAAGFLDRHVVVAGEASLHEVRSPPGDLEENVTLQEQEREGRVCRSCAGRIRVIIVFLTRSRDGNIPMPSEISIAKAKATLSAQVRTAEDGQPVVITRHGKPVAALVPAADLEQLQRLRAAGPEGGLASVAGGWEGSDELVELVECHRRTAPRGSGLGD